MWSLLLNNVRWTLEEYSIYKGEMNGRIQDTINEIQFRMEQFGSLMNQVKNWMSNLYYNKRAVCQSVRHALSHFFVISM